MVATARPAKLLDSVTGGSEGVESSIVNSFGVNQGKDEAEFVGDQGQVLQ